MGALEPSKAIERLHRQIRAGDGPQAVLQEKDRRFYVFPANPPDRLDALLGSPKFSKRVVGVFTPDVSIEDLR